MPAQQEAAKVIGKGIGSLIATVVKTIVKYFVLGFLVTLAWNGIVPIVAKGALDAGLVSLVTELGDYLALGIFTAVIGLLQKLNTR